MTIGVVLLGVAALTNETNPDFGPRVAVLLLLAAFGLPTLVARALESPLAWPARAALGFLAVGALSAALSPSPLLGFFGTDQNGTAWVFFLCVAAVWALGTELDSPAAELLGKGLLLVALLNGAATVLEVAGKSWSGLAEIVAHLPGLHFGGGQPTGIFDNPVYSAQVIVGGLALLAWRARSRTLSWWVMTAGLGAATYLTGERYGPLILLGLVVWAGVTRGLRAGGCFAGASIGGLFAGVALKKAVEASTTATFRSVTTTGGAFGPRIHEWMASLHAIVARPLLGIGPSQSMTATVPYLSRHFLVANGPFPDVHNLVLEIAVTTGLLGLALFLAWLVPPLLRARGPLVPYGVVLLAGGLIEPLQLTTTALAFLALGASMSTASAARLPSRHRRLDPRSSFKIANGARAAIGIFALLAGLDVMLGNTELHDGVQRGDPTQLIAASRHLPMWSDGPSATASLLTLAGVRQHDNALLRQAVAWGRKAVTRNPTDAASWTRLGYDYVLLDDLASASDALGRSLEVDPDIMKTYLDEVSVTVLQGHTNRAISWASEAHSLFHNPALGTLANCLRRFDTPASTPNGVIEACFPKQPTGTG